MKYFVETYGCQMNVAESLALENELRKRRWIQAENADDADLIVLNTCAVRQTAENRIWGRIGFYKNLKTKKKLALAVMGCMTERLKDEIKKRASAVDILVGTNGKDDFIHFLEDFELGKKHTDFMSDTGYTFQKNYADPNEAQAFVPIMHGCDNFCSYCIVPHVRGREISRSVQDILSELQMLEEGRVKEITLLGQNVNSFHEYLPGASTDFPDLLKRILADTNFEWIRFMSSHPKDFSAKLIELIASSSRICKHIHLPVQHGSNAVLRAMNRKYTVESYLELIQALRRAVPDVSLSTDILVGFPGETEEDFNLTLKLIHEVQFADAFTYYFNPREGTAAYAFAKQVEKEIKLSRLNTLIEQQREISESIRSKRIGNIEKVLVETVSKNSSNEYLARTEHNDMVIIKGNKNMLGHFYTIRLKSLKGVTFIGEVL